MEISIRSPVAVVLLAIFINLAAINPTAHSKSIKHSTAVNFNDNANGNASIELLINADRHPGDPKDFPFIALIEYERNDDMKNCLGAIVHKNWILAAGCSRIWFEPERFTITVGFGLSAEDQGKRYDVRDIVLHPDFPGDNYFNHFALLKTKKSMRMGKLAQPIGLNRKAVKNAMPAIIARWQLVREHFVLASKFVVAY